MKPEKWENTNNKLFLCLVVFTGHHHDFDVAYLPVKDIG